MHYWLSYHLRRSSRLEHGVWPSALDTPGCGSVVDDSPQEKEEEETRRKTEAEIMGGQARRRS